MKRIPRHPPEYLCQYGDCQERREVKRTFIIGKPHGEGAPRYCSAIHALLGLAKVVGIHFEVETLLYQKGLLK